MRTRYLFFCLVVLSLNIAKAQTVSILFVGNSLTYSNDLPAMLKEVAKLHDIRIKTDCLCHPNYGLEDHWQDGDFQKIVKAGSYDYVVFQQGLSSQEYGGKSLLEFGGYISEMSKQNGVKPVYFMVWPSLGYYHTFDGVILNHRNAALENAAQLVRVGEVWRQIHEKSGNAGLYFNDGFHPSTKGTALAALVMFQSLLGDLNPEIVDKKYGKQFSVAELEMILADKVGN